MFLLHKQFSERGKNRTNNSSFKAWSSCNKIRWDQMEIMATTKKTKCQTQKKNWYYIISKNIMQTRLLPRVFFHPITVLNESLFRKKSRGVLPRCFLRLCFFECDDDLFFFFAFAFAGFWFWSKSILVFGFAFTSFLLNRITNWPNCQPSHCFKCYYVKPFVWVEWHIQNTSKLRL